MTVKGIKLVVTDLDGTLLSPEKEISMEAALVINQLKEKGIMFTFITGRPPAAIERFVAQIAVTAPVVCCNGAVMDGRKIPMELLPLADLIREAHARELTVLVLAGETEYAVGETSWTRARERTGCDIPFASVEELLKKDGIYKVAIMAMDQEQAEFVKMLPRFSELQADYTISVYGTGGCEIVAKDVNKQTGLAELCRRVRIGMEDVLAIGDNENDIEMIKEAGIGAVVSNASAGAKAAADYVCEVAYTEGVIEAIRRFV